MELAMMTEPQLGQTYEDLLEAARYCEANGLGVFARADHYFWRSPAPHATDAFATLAGLARETDTVRLCVMVSPISFRHPAVIAKTAATIDEMSGGRLMLGVGTGWMELEHDAFGLELWPMQERFERLEEALGYLRAAFAEGSPGFEGRHYSLERIDVRPKPTGPLPLIVGGGGPRRTPRLAGRFADEYNLFTSPPAPVRQRVELAREAAVEAGRDPNDIVVTMMGPLFLRVDEAAYRRRLQALCDLTGRSPEEQEQHLTEAGTPIGPPDEVRATMAALEEAGVSRYYFQQLGPVDYEAFDEAVALLSG